MRLSQEEEKAVELILKGEYDILGPIEYCPWAGVYYFFDGNNNKVRVIGNASDILLYNYESIKGHVSIMGIRVSYGARCGNPSFEVVLKAAMSRGYIPDACDYFNISSDADYKHSNNILNITYLAEHIRRSDWLWEASQYADDIDGCASSTKEYIDTLEDEVNEWQSAAEALVTMIQDHLNSDDSEKEDLQRALDKLTYHHLLNNKENK